LRWNTAVECLIQLYLQNPERLTFNLWLCATKDRGTSRFWRREFPVNDHKLEDFADQLPKLLDEAFARVSSWSSDSLEFGTKLRLPRWTRPRWLRW
jgi:hypothetical protein